MSYTDYEKSRLTFWVIADKKKSSLELVMLYHLYNSFSFSTYKVFLDLNDIIHVLFLLIHKTNLCQWWFVKKCATGYPFLYPSGSRKLKRNISYCLCSMWYPHTEPLCPFNTLCQAVVEFGSLLQTGYLKYNKNWSNTNILVVKEKLGRRD